MSKLLIKILLIYITVLTVLPCFDNCFIIFCSTESCIHIEKHHTNKHDDMCSPLCNCLCCITKVSISNSYTLETLFSTIDFEYSHTLDLNPYALKPTSPPPKA